MKVVLYNPQSSASRKPILPMSLLALGALLEGRYEYIIVDGNLETDPLARLETLVSEWGAGVLGMTVMPGPPRGARPERGPRQKIPSFFGL